MTETDAFDEVHIGTELPGEDVPGDVTRGMISDIVGSQIAGRTMTMDDGEETEVSLTISKDTEQGDVEFILDE